MKFLRYHTTTNYLFDNTIYGIDIRILCSIIFTYVLTEEPTMKPYYVQQAIFRNDTEALKRYGKKGGKKSAEIKRLKKQLKEDIASFKAWMKQLHDEELNRVAGERHDDLLDDL